MEYGKAKYFCPKCYGKSFSTVRLEKQDEHYVCTQDSRHVFYIDSSGFPKSVQ